MQDVTPCTAPNLTNYTQPYDLTNIAIQAIRLAEESMDAWREFGTRFHEGNLRMACMLGNAWRMLASTCRQTGKGLSYPEVEEVRQLRCCRDSRNALSQERCKLALQLALAAMDQLLDVPAGVEMTETQEILTGILHVVEIAESTVASETF